MHSPLLYKILVLSNMYSTAKASLMSNFIQIMHKITILMILFDVFLQLILILKDLGYPTIF